MTKNTNSPCRFAPFAGAVILFVAVLISGGASVLAATPKGAAMVMDAKSGQILYNDSGDELRHPASLTKMMTIYMVFDLMKRGRLSNDTLIEISKTAAAQPPSKLGLKAGRKIKLIHAIKSLVTKSANDIAVAIAEHIGGNESNFARMMTAKARSLGMTRTVFRNASGLPNSGQLSTARDMLTLALSLQDNFPVRYGLFKTRYFKYGGKTYKNHNTLLGRTKGVDGIKTGYIRASGFNLVTSMRRDGKHIVAAVFGGKTAGRRNRRMRALLSRHLRQASTKRTRRSRPLLIAAPNRAVPPVRKPVRVARPATGVKPPHRAARARSRNTTAYRKPTIKVANVRRVDVVAHAKARSGLGAGVPQPRSRTYPAVHESLSTAVSAPGTRHTNGSVRGRAPSTLQDQLANLLAQSDAVARPSGPSVRHQPVVGQTASVATPAAVSQRAPASSYQIQIGAYRTPVEAQRRLATVASRASNLLSGYRPLTQPVDRGPLTLYRARFAGFQAVSTARNACRELKKQSIDCLVTR